jgi:hypothetical protein
MPKIRRKPPPQHLVIVDTNILWDKDKKLPVSPAFDAFWGKNSPLLPMTLHVPHVVMGELHFQQTTSALKSLGAITEAFQELTGITHSSYGHKCNEATIRNQVRAKLDRWLKGLGGAELATPVAHIDWAAVVEGAVWRKPPFTFDPKDQKNEKGFRDAVILETVAHACTSVKVDDLVIFVCNDYLLRTTAESRLKASKKFLAFESLADFESYIQLTQQKFTNEFVKSIQSHARIKFFLKGDSTCIYSKNDIGKRILTDFAAELDFKDQTKNPLNFLAQAIGTTAPTAKLAKQMVLIGSTQFAKLEGEREFHWISRVDIARLFEIEKSAGLLEIAMPTVRRVQVVGFDVNWKANVKADGRFHDIEVVGIAKSETQSHEASEDLMARYRLT